MFGETQWHTTRTRSTTGENTSLSLTRLTPGTTYEVQASLSSDFADIRSAVFTTSSPAPSVSAVNIANITETTATATVGIAHAGTTQKTVYLRHRVFGENEWGTVQTETTSGSSAEFALTGLAPETTYEVAASLTGQFSASDLLTATFTTQVPDPTVSSLTIGSITQTSGVATVTIADAGEAQKQVYLRFRADGTSEWSSPALTATTYGDSVAIDLAGFAAGTGHEVQTALNGSFTDAVSVSFATLRYPSLSGIEVTGISKTAATVEIDITDPDGTSQTVNLRYSVPNSQDNWSEMQAITSTTAAASIELSGLALDTEYEVQASLSSDFDVTVADKFRTLPPDPVVSGVSIGAISQTTALAEIDIANSDGTGRTVNLRYRATTPTGVWSDTLTATSSTDSAGIDLSRLRPGTEYEVQASLDSSFPGTRTKNDTFTTLRYPGIGSLKAENIGRNGATISATIADAHGDAQTVYVRHRQERHSTWRPTQQADSIDDMASLRLRGLSSGTEYIAEVSLDDLFLADETKFVAFTTKERPGSDMNGAGVAHAAQAVSAPLLGLSPLTLRFVAIEGGDNPSPQTFLVWNRAQGTMAFILSNQQQWLSQEPTSGVSIGPEDPVEITASVDSSELASGQYVDIIEIDVSSSGNSRGQVVVVLDVLPPDYVRQLMSRADGGTVILPDGTVKIVVQPLAPPKDVDIELMKVNLQAHEVPPGVQDRVLVAVESNTYEPGGDTPEDIAYSPYLEVWMKLSEGDGAACADSRVRVYSVQGDWSLIGHRCETNASGGVWTVAEVERLGAFALVIDDSPATPTPTLTPTTAAAAKAAPSSSVTGASSSSIVRLSLPAAPPTPTPFVVPTTAPQPAPTGNTATESETLPTPTETVVPATVQPAVTAMQANADTVVSMRMGGIILAALGAPMMVGALILAFLIYRERRRRDDV